MLKYLHYMRVIVSCQLVGCSFNKWHTIVGIMDMVDNMLPPLIITHSLIQHLFTISSNTGGGGGGGVNEHLTLDGDAVAVYWLMSSNSPCSVLSCNTYNIDEGTKRQLVVIWVVYMPLITTNWGQIFPPIVQPFPVIKYHLYSKMKHGIAQFNHRCQEANLLPCGPAKL